MVQKSDVKTSPLAEENENLNLLDKRISSSALKEAKKSTRDFIYYYIKPKEQKKHFDFGNAIELYLLDGDAFEQQVAVFDEDTIIAEIKSSNPNSKSPRSTNVYKDAKNAFDTANEGKYCINSTGDSSLETIKQIAQLCMEHPDFHLLHSGNYQDPFEWVCPKTGLKRYARTDIFDPESRTIIDVKTDATGDFERACSNNDYWLQALDQMTGAVESGKMESVERYMWFVITNKAPYFVEFYELDVNQLLRVEEIYWSTHYRLKEDLSNDPYKIVWHKVPIQNIKVPNYYK